MSSKDHDYNYYNGERKEAFIEYYKADALKALNADLGTATDNSDGQVDVRVNRKVKYTACRVMSSIANYERAFEKDFADFGSYEMNYLMANYIATTGVSAPYQRTIMAVLKKYLMFCAITNVITTKQYRSHPIAFATHINEYSEKSLMNQLEKSNELQVIKSSDCFIFKTEEQFFDYIEKMFGSDRFYVAGALAALFYYGFDIRTIVELLKSDFDEDTRIVKGVVIENDVAFKMLVRSKHIEMYEYNRSDSTEIARLTVRDGEHLIRSTGRGGGTEDDKISVSQGSRLSLLEDIASESLPNGSPYKKIRIRGSTIMNLRAFHILSKMEEELGTDEVYKRIKAGEYRNMSYNKYRRMKLRARDVEDVNV